MDFDLNEPAHPPILDAFNTTVFDTEFWEWNMDYNERNDEEVRLAESPSGATAVEVDNLEVSIESPLHNEDELEELINDAEMDEGDNNIEIAIEKRLEPGSTLDSLDQAYLLYCEYAHLKGFSVKKGIQKYYNKTAEVRVKEYLCSCHGKSNSEKLTSKRLHMYKKQDFRCMCPANLRVVREQNGKWTVSKFIKEHNHELADKENSYLLRSSRLLSHAKKSVLEALQSAGIPISRACLFMENESGGPQNTGFTRKDAYNHIDAMKRKSKLNDADSNALVRHFVGKSNKENFFYWDMQTDAEGRLVNFFFRDSRSAIDYEYFGDVLSVDTTYRTNKYDLICAPFVGVNHHMKNCLFGLAFLSDETTKTFEWLFSTFLESMQGKEPQVIFSDQCQAMMNAIDSQFKSSSHRLCQWHINQNAPSHFGGLNGNTDFKNRWFHCMNGCESEDEFEDQWKKMIDDYGLADNRWFSGMYNLRRRWSSIFTIDKFCAGLHATSRSEITNKVLKDLAKKSGSLYDFVMKYEQVQLNWRRLEGEDDTASLGTPGLLVENNELLEQAANFFTRRVFLSYEYEATHSLNVKILERPDPNDHSTEVHYVVMSSTPPKRARGF